MGTPCLLVDNFFNQRIYPNHTLSAAEASADAPLVGAGRRTTFDAYNSVTTNLEAWLKSRCGITRAADMAIVDRGHNQGGKTVKVQCSDDDFGVIQDAFNGLTPSTPGTGSLDDALGVRNWEGAWLKRFPLRSAQDWRYDVPALGSGVVATVPGLWIGLSWQPGAARLPFAPSISELIVEESQSDQGWTGRGKATPRRTGTLRFMFKSLFDAELALQHLVHYQKGRPMWIVPDDERAEDAFLAICPTGAIGIEHPEAHWMYPDLSLPYRELDPVAT